MSLQEQYGLQGTFVILAIAFGIYLLMKPFTTYLLRRRLIELGQWNDQANRSLTEERNSLIENLKWGLILLFTGIGLIVVEFLPYSFNSSLPYGVISVFTAIGFLVYYLIVRNNTKSST
ncbi:hypothetical protein GCM10023187_07690 [Nibrella viscosa]|uniref:DUF6249 domain-containing protein n=1 Tax=Nibrella viscosa TaxID=1084524 RepID=A0ABP8JY84_9BACT